MAVTVIRGERSMGQNLGEALGVGLSGVVGGIARSKVAQLEKREAARGIKALMPGLSDQDAVAFAHLSPELQKEFIKSRRAEIETRDFHNVLEKELGYSQPDDQGMQALQGMNSQPDERQALESMLQQGMGGDPQDAIMMALQKALGGQQPMAQQPPALAQAATNAPTSSVPQNSSNSNLTKLKPEMRLKLEALKEQRRATSVKERGDSFKIVKKEIDKVHDRAERARINIFELEKAKKYNKMGKLYQGRLRQGLEAFGLQDFFTNEPTQVVGKIIAGLEQGVAEGYGTGRPTNFLAERYNRSIPSLINTKEGFEAVSNNKILEQKALIEVDNAMREIEKEVNAARASYPFDIKAQAYERARPKLDELERKSIENIDNAVAAVEKKSSLRDYGTLPKASNYQSKKPLIDTDKKLAGTVVNGQWKWRKATQEELSRAGV